MTSRRVDGRTLGQFPVFAGVAASEVRIEMTTPEQFRIAAE